MLPTSFRLLRFSTPSKGHCGCSRFEALHKVGASRTIKGISEASFQSATWPWHRRIVNPSHVTSLTPGPPSLAQITASRPDTPMVPSRPRPRRVTN
eukprot:Skav207339  [mRNA]  locus=scaffold426:63882:64656:+ [translate_table: standard]